MKVFWYVNFLSKPYAWKRSCYQVDDDDDNDDNELFLWNGLPTKGVYTSFPARAIVRDHHSKSLTHCEQGFSLHIV